MIPALVLALADPIHNQDALARAPLAGWLMLGAAIGLAALLFAHREAFRRLVLRAEDPRTMGAFRIAFGLCCLGNVNGLWELFEYLFTDEGLFPTEIARQVVAAEQFAGFGNGLDGEPYGFFDLDAVLAWLRGPRYSPLFFWDSPRFFWCYLAAFEVAMVCTIVGWKTRWMKWIAWFLFHGIIQRNHVFWEGTENVYRTFFFYLCLSRCDRAYSLDNWLRCRRLPAGSDEPIYRLIPGWPRLLVILQCAAIYCTTGAVKNGGIWWSGDAFYYAFNLDHFYRVPPQQLSAWLGTTLFKLNTHVVHAWETFFPAVVVGLFVRFGLRERIPLSTRDRWIARLGALALGGFALALVLWLYPVHWAPAPKSSWTLARTQTFFAAAWLVGMVVIARGWPRLRDRPPTVRGHVLDLDWFCRWFLGRRLWVGLGIVFHLHLVALMNIGWFSPGCLTGFICFVNGGELATLFAELRRVGRRLGLPIAVREPIAAEDPARWRHTRDGVRLPDHAIAIAIGLAIVGVPLRVYAGLAYGWTLAGVLAYLAGALWRARHTPHASDDDPPHVAWAYRAPGRLLAGAVFVFHVVAVAVWLLPDKASLSWRTTAQKTFGHWLKLTQTTQGWKMFAPNPPRQNVMLRVLVTDAAGQQWDMNTDVYAPEKRPIPWVFYTRERKINRRIAGGEGGKGVWYQKWHARWWCRHWTLTHDGAMPQRVELVKLTYPIPDPAYVQQHGPYDPATQMRERGTQTSVYVAECATEPEAQPSDEVRARHGLPPDPHERPPRWGNLRNKLRAWKKKQGEAADEDAPVD